MSNSTSKPVPSLPQNDDQGLQDQRAFDLSLARTGYNYTFSYMEPLSLSADVPKGEDFTPEYFKDVLKVFWHLADNFINVVGDILQREIEDDLSNHDIKALRKARRAAKDLIKAIKDGDDLGEILLAFKDWVVAFAKMPAIWIKSIFKNGGQFPRELAAMLKGLAEVFEEFREEGFTAFLKSTLFEMLDTGNGREYLFAESLEDYEKLFDEIRTPEVLTLPTKPWMNVKRSKDIWKEDWYLGYMQIAGFNTTNLRAVRTSSNATDKSFDLNTLLEKFPVTDAMLQSVSGQEGITLEQAAKDKKLFACDYSMIDGIEGGVLNDLKRYPVAPIGLFYWNEEPPEGFPPSGAMQPIAIQIGQKFDADRTPIFTPNDCSDANDPNGVKWMLAKSAIQNACAVQHETVAHLGACHLVIDPMVIAANRQLNERHPLMILLKPHFRFTLKINNGAYHSLIVPGGVVSSVVSSTLAGSAQMVIDAHAKWRFDEQLPHRLFKDRGVDEDSLSSFPFREDTLDLWTSIREYVGEYLKLYYNSDPAVAKENMLADYELQSWVNEMVDKRFAATKGMDGLTETGDPEKPYQLDDLEYFIDVVSLIIYTASAQHASVNYAQYPLMTFIPSVSGTLYAEPPTRDQTLDSMDDMLRWLPPLDVALYQISFGWLLSEVQYDKLGHYDKGHEHYFQDHNVKRLVKDFQKQLAEIEKQIDGRNKERPFAYDLQRPSKVPNSISI